MCQIVFALAFNNNVDDEFFTRTIGAMFGHPHVVAQRQYNTGSIVDCHLCANEIKQAKHESPMCG
jgi:2-oxo-4-hydroxy-4-carboxy--5-ureidoimidazoline (OHCU) decarboxylase